MALKKCKECNKEISSKAESCPNCGVIIKKKNGCFTYLVFFILFSVLVSYIIGNSNIYELPDTNAQPSDLKAALRKESTTEIIKERNTITTCWKYVGISQSCASHMPKDFTLSLTDKIQRICQTVQNEEVKQSSQDTVKMWTIIWEGTKKAASKKTYSAEECAKYHQVFSKMVK